MKHSEVTSVKDIKIYLHGGLRRDYAAIYVNSKLEWSDVQHDSSFSEKLLELLDFVGNKRIPNTVEINDVPDEIAVRMGLSVAFPDTLAEYLKFEDWLPEKEH